MRSARCSPCKPETARNDDVRLRTRGRRIHRATGDLEAAAAIAHCVSAGAGGTGGTGEQQHLT